MSEQTTDIVGIPDWYLETFEVVQHVDGGLRSAEMELREAIETEDLNERVRAEIQGVLEALHSIKGNLVLVDMTAREVLDQILSDAA